MYDDDHDDDTLIRGGTRSRAKKGSRTKTHRAKASPTRPSKGVSAKTLGLGAAAAAAGIAATMFLNRDKKNKVPGGGD